VLALDAGSPVVSVAIGMGGEALAARAASLQRSSTQLLALVAEVLAEVGAQPGDLAGVVALAGPGSFTGLRVGLATALGLVQGLGVPAQALPTLAVLAAASGAPPGTLVIAAVDALRGEWSAQAFRAGPVPQALGEMTLVPSGELLQRLLPAAASHGKLAETTEIPETQEIIAFGVSALARGNDAAGGLACFREAPPLAPAALRLAAAMPRASWRAASLAAPIYSRPPATTSPKPRSVSTIMSTGAEPTLGMRPGPGPETPIRPAEPADLPHLVQIEASGFADPWPESVMAAELAQPGGVMLVAGRGGQPPAGYACFRLGGGEAELLRIAVAPAERGRGIGKRLLAAGLERLRTAGVASCYLEVRPGNASALAVYRALGFEPCGRRPAYYRDGMDALVLRRSL
jgi:tRNA threonylcarbamoyl adenosine modification protein YeaZ/ribosomal-protein-alanine acetyltransferase